MMKYYGPSVEHMRNKQGKNGVYSNRQDISFKLFPFTTHLASPEINPGQFLRRASGYTVSKEKDTPIIVEEVISLIEEDTPGECKNQIYGALREIATFTNESNTGNYRIALSSNGSSNSEKSAWYLASMTENETELRKLTRSFIESSDGNANVIERLIYCVVPLEEETQKQELPYYAVNKVLSSVFLEDLKLILGDQKLAETYLPTLLNFYFFILIAENCISVSKRMNGARDAIAELYFALDWEKTTQGRLCYKKGFKTLEPAIEDMFIHAGVLEILNTQGDISSAEPVDYIAIKEFISQNPEDEERVASKIRDASNFLLSLKFDDDTLFSSLDHPSDECKSVEQEIDYLYRIVRTILFETQRNKPRGDYSNSYREFCQGDSGFEKRRGRSGIMLNITDDTLLLLTVVSIGHRDSMSLTELFGQFERRGVFMDETTKEEVARFFEKRSMLDKKSDSGETQYVKRIL